MPSSVTPMSLMTSKTFTSFGLNTDSSYHWQNDPWTLPLNLFGQQFVESGRQPIALQVDGRYHAEGPGGAPERGLRLQGSLLSPK